MKRYDSIFELAKKIAKAVSKGEKPVDLKETKLLSEEAKQRLFQELSKETTEKVTVQLKKIDAEKDWENILPKLKPHKKLYFSSFYKVAAAAVLFISVAYVTFYYTKQTEGLEPTGSQIVAGTDKAVLTLEDGSLVELQKGVPFKNELVKTNGERLEYQSVKNPTYTAFNYLSVPSG